VILPSAIPLECFWIGSSALLSRLKDGLNKHKRKKENYDAPGIIEKKLP